MRGGPGSRSGRKEFVYFLGEKIRLPDSLPGGPDSDLSTIGLFALTTKYPLIERFIHWQYSRVVRAAFKASAQSTTGWKTWQDWIII